MSQALVALSGAAIGSVTGLLGAFISARQQQRLEALKLTAERRAETKTRSVSPSQAVLAAFHGSSS